MSMLAFLLRYFLVPQPGSVQAELRSPRFDTFSTANLLVLLPILFYHAMREKRNTWVLAPGLFKSQGGEKKRVISGKLAER
jgi:hypothetical protein